jgi:hypothetical protein
VNALTNAQVGKYVNENFVASFQKVATFRIVGGQKQGGNVATYFCAPDGRVLHVIPGPVDAGTFLRESKWVVDSAHKALEESKKTGQQFKAIFRRLHAAKLKSETGLIVEAVTSDPDANTGGALSYRDPTGQPLAPVLPPPPINGPDVTLAKAAMDAKQAAEANVPGARALLDDRGRRWVLGNQGRADMLLAAHSLQPIEKIYGTVFENILGEKISTRPVEIITPFPWRNEGRKGTQIDQELLKRVKNQRELLEQR